MPEPKLSIIVPCYNEEGTVGLVLERLLKVPFTGWQTEVIAVNDGSTDGTAQVLKGFSARVKVVNLAQNSGKGSAVKQGLDLAGGDFAVIQDADLECDPREIPLLLNELKKYPAGEKVAVMGSRELHKDNHKSRFFTRLGSLTITKLINLLYGSSLSDALMGYKLFSRQSFGFFPAGGFEAENLFIIRLLKEGYRVAEVPVTYTPRGYGEGKKIKYRHGLKIIFRILRYWITGR